MAKVVGDYRSRIGTEEGIGTLQLGPQAYIDPRDQRYVHDAYQYFLNQQGGGEGAAPGGVAVAQDPTTMIPQTGGEGITAASAAQNMGGVNTPFEQNLIDQGAGVQIAPGQPVMDPGSGLYTQEDLDAFNQIPVNREYGDPMDIGYGEGQVDPNLAAAVGGRQISDPFLASGAAGGARLPATQATTTLPSGDVFATNDPMLQEKMDYTEKTPAWWESARNNFVETGQDINNIFTDLKDKGIDVGKIAISSLMNMAQPGLGLLTNILPRDTSEDTWNRQFAVGGEGYDELIESNPDLGGRLEGYARDLIAGTGEGKDPFGRNTVSAFGNYEKALAEDLQYTGNNQFSLDKKAYAQAYFDKKGIANNPNEAKAFEEKYGISPTGAPVTRDRLIDEGIAAADEEDDMFEPTIIPKEKPVTGVIKPGTLADPNWNKFKAEYITDDVSDAELYGDFDKGTTGAIPPGEKGGPGYIEPPGTLATDKWNTGAFDYGYDDSDDYGTYEPPASFSPPTNTDRPGGDRDSPAPSPTSTPSGPTYGPHGGGGADRDPAPSRSAPSAPTGISGPPGRGGSSGGPPSQGGGGGGGGGGCFLKGTQVTMADGSTKAIEQVDLGDNVAKGGKVFATGKFLVENLHDYKGIKVSGSHMVSEDGNWVRVEDSKHGKALGDDEHTVYVFGAENRRILINNILFTDYFEVNEQEKLMENEEDYFKNWKSYIKKDDINKINVLNAS